MRIVLADDHAIVRDGLRACLADHEDYEIVGEAEDGIGLIELVEECAPDLAIVDIAMPRLGGIDAVRRIVATCVEPPKLVVLSMHTDQEFVAEAFDAGVNGFVAKACALEDLLWAIKTVLDGGVYISPSIAGGMVEQLLVGMRPTTVRPISNLTPREQETMRLLVDGLSVKEVAFELGLSHKTVHTYRAAIRKKLGIDSIAELTKYAIRHGITDLK